MKQNFEFLGNYPAPLRILIFLLTLVLLWLPLAAPLYLGGSDRNLISILTLILLYAEFLILIQIWGQKVYHQSQLLKRYGLVRNSANYHNFFRGLIIGLISLFSLFILEGLLGFVRWNIPNFQLIRFILEGFLVGTGVGFAEELFFRGWLLDELQRNYSAKLSLWVSSLIYAGLHFIKPLEEIQRTWLQFPGLVILGLIFVWAKLAFLPSGIIKGGTENNNLTSYPSGWLGLPMGLHAGLVWGYYIINVGQLVSYSQQVPDWMTGIDQNPLAGVMGLLCLGAIAIFIWKKSLFRYLN